MLKRCSIKLKKCSCVSYDYMTSFFNSETKRMKYLLKINLINLLINVTINVKNIIPAKNLMEAK